MPKGDSSRVDTLEALVAERRKHEGYLAKLEERRDGTPEAVYAKLRDEYLTKLTDAQVRAAAEAESLSAGLAEDEAAVAEAQEKLSALEAEKLEGELRSAVGEFDNKEWNKKLTALKANIMMAERERDARLEVFERARALIDEARGTAAGADGTETPSATAPSRAPSGAPSSAPAPTKPRPTSAIQSGPSFDELAFLNSVVGRTSTPSAPPPRASKPVEQVTEGTGGAERDGGKSKATPAKAAAPVASDGSEPDTGSAEKPAKAGKASKSDKDGEPASGPSASKEEDANNAFGRPTPRTTQAVKTLKCQECGTFNYPTEWYCERCGGELAAL